MEKPLNDGTEGQSPMEYFIEQQEKGELTGQEIKQDSLESSQEALRGNLERLSGNLKTIDTLPLEAVNSQEGKEIAQKFSEKIFDKIKNFGSEIKEKIASGLSKCDDSEKLVAILGSAAGIAIIGPILLQIARSKWPEVGVAMDALPDFVQYYVHMDLYSNLVEKVGGIDQLWKWDSGNFDGMNLLADISSGRVDFASLSLEQQNLLENSLPADSLGQIKFFAENPTLVGDRLIDAKEIASQEAVLSTGGPTFGNTALVGASALGLGGALNKLGMIARKSISR